MSQRIATRVLVVVALLGAAGGTAGAAPALRVQVDQRGDFVLLGNSLGQECAAGTPAPVVGTVGACGLNPADSAPDVFWRSDSPAAGQAQADSAITAAQARSTAVLALPAGATVTHAFLYWGATLAAPGADTQVTLDRPGAGSFTLDVAASQSWQSANNAYQAVADVTTFVQANGPGAYRVSGVDAATFVDANNSNLFAGWWMVVFYEAASLPLRNLALFDGLDVVANGMPQNVALSGLFVPASDFTGRLGVVAFEGDNAIPGDALFFNGGAALVDALNPADNFFNGTRSWLGAAVSVAGDLPQLTGTAQSLGGMDLDVIDVTAKLTPLQTSASIQATSIGDVYFLAGFVTSISAYRPDFTTSTKVATDANGGSLVAGDVLHYTITVTNSGNDSSTSTVLTDPLPLGVTYVPETILVGGVAQSDASGDDTAEYTAATRTVTARLGSGADAAQGGQLASGASVEVSFDVQVDLDFVGRLANQAFIAAAGLLGSATESTPTDGNGAGAGVPPTEVLVDQCATSGECAAPTPVCDTGVSPLVCVACLADLDCGDAASGAVCVAKACASGCRGTGGNGCPAATYCTSADASVGTCVACLVDAHCGAATSGTVCEGNQCGAGCRGTNGNGCPAPTVCTSSDDTAGACVQCLGDGDCGGGLSGLVCEAQVCLDGCRGSGGNGCPTPTVCTSTDGAAGACVECLADGDCGDATSGRVCEAHVCVDGCRGSGGNGCPAATVCTSADGAAGACVECLADGDCGDAASGQVCETQGCVDGCRGSGGNGCPTGTVCTSSDDAAGACVQCLVDSDCGGAASGLVCEAAECTAGCRGDDGNGCPEGQACSSSDATAGTCVGCVADGDCGGPTSGRICEAYACGDGCRGSGGNGCPPSQTCSSTDQTVGTCDLLPVAPASGGCSCTVPQRPASPLAPWLIVLIAAPLWRRRRRR